MTARTKPAALTCPQCGRILFLTRAGLYPLHRNLKWRSEVVWCTASDGPIQLDETENA